MTAPALSLGVVVPTLNAAGTLAATLESLGPAMQVGAEVIVVDGGSKDSTIAIAQGRGVRVEHCGGGMYAALNHGFRSLRSDWLTWINADDLLYSDKLIGRMQSAGNADVLYGPVDFIDMAGRFMHSWNSASPADLLPLYRAGYSPLLQQGTLFRSQVFEQISGFDETFRFVGDADFWWRALEAKTIFHCCKHPPAAAFRLHGGQLSQRYAGPMRAEHDRMVAAHGGRRRSLRSWLALCRFRGRNLPSYLVRCLRRRDLEGHIRLARGYEVTHLDG